MARTPAKLLPKRKKLGKAKLSKSALWLANHKHMGEEPSFTDKPVTDIQLILALNWYSSMCTIEEGRTYLEDWLKSQKRGVDAQTIRLISDDWFPINAAWYARMLSRGANLSEKTIKWFNNTISDTKKRIVVPKKRHPPKSIQANITEKATDFIGNFEYAIDRLGWIPAVSISKALETANMTAVMAKRVLQYYTAVRDEALVILMPKCDCQLKEAYNHYTTDQLKKRAQFYVNVVKECQSFVVKAK